MNDTKKATALDSSIANINGTVKVSNVFIITLTPHRGCEVCPWRTALNSRSQLKKA
jgi:hypothetical protein